MLNLDGGDGFQDMVLSRFLDIILSLFPDVKPSALPETVPLLIRLCRAVRSRTFFSVKGKYSVKCVVISSLGGRCPKKLRSFEGFFGAADELLPSGVIGGKVGEEAGSNAFSGSRTPRPLKMLIELARLVFFPVRAEETRVSSRSGLVR
jgi:hypothetical protein